MRITLKMSTANEMDETLDFRGNCSKDNGFTKPKSVFLKSKKRKILSERKLKKIEKYIP